LYEYDLKIKEQIIYLEKVYKNLLDKLNMSYPIQNTGGFVEKFKPNVVMKNGFFSNILENEIPRNFNFSF
jgi:hypothetical protein